MTNPRENRSAPTVKQWRRWSDQLHRIRGEIDNATSAGDYGSTKASNLVQYAATECFERAKRREEAIDV